MTIRTFLPLLLLLILGLLVVFVVDPLEPTTLSTPFCLGLVLLLISLRLKISLVVTTSILYALLTSYALVQFLNYTDQHFHSVNRPYFWLFQRGGLFLVVCTMAIYLAYYRTAIERARNHLQDILSKLPAPMVISDASGIITYTNDALIDVFRPADPEIVGKRFIELFMSDIQEGKAMRYYIEVFSEHDPGVHEIGVRPFGGPIQMNARLICLGAGPSRVMITLLSKREEMPEEARRPGL